LANEQPKAKGAERKTQGDLGGDAGVKGREGRGENFFGNGRARRRAFGIMRTGTVKSENFSAACKPNPDIGHAIALQTLCKERGTGPRGGRGKYCSRGHLIGSRQKTNSTEH